MSQCYGWTGQPERAVESDQRAITIAQALGDHVLEGLATQRIGQAYASLGEYRRAIEPRHDLLGSGTAVPDSGRCPHRHLLAQPEHRDLPALQLRPLFLLVACDLGQALMLSGRVSEAVVLLEEATAQSATLRLMPTHAWNVPMLAESYLLAGRGDDAAREIERGLGLARANKQRWLEAEGYRIKSGVRCHLALARLGRRAGDGGAGQHLERAATLFAEMGMRFWMEQAEAEKRAFGGTSKA